MSTLDLRKGLMVINGNLTIKNGEINEITLLVLKRGNGK